MKIVVARVWNTERTLGVLGVDAREVLQCQKLVHNAHKTFPHCHMEAVE